MLCYLSLSVQGSYIRVPIWCYSKCNEASCGYSFNWLSLFSPQQTCHGLSARKGRRHNADFGFDLPYDNMYELVILKRFLCLLKEAGQLVVSGSCHMFSDQYIDKEENSKILVSPAQYTFFFFWSHVRWMESYSVITVVCGRSIILN